MTRGFKMGRRQSKKKYEHNHRWPQREWKQQVSWECWWTHTKNSEHHKKEHALKMKGCPYTGKTDKSKYWPNTPASGNESPTLVTCQRTLQHRTLVDLWTVKFLGFVKRGIMADSIKRKRWAWNQTWTKFWMQLANRWYLEGNTGSTKNKSCHNNLVIFF